MLWTCFATYALAVAAMREADPAAELMERRGRVEVWIAPGDATNYPARLTVVSDPADPPRVCVYIDD